MGPFWLHEGQRCGGRLLGDLVWALCWLLPQVKELVEYYKGYNVTVLGLTSPQGAVTSEMNAGR